jgi:dipeptidyl aminopeptidase/acylaminoacyl peptidase
VLVLPPGQGRADGPFPLVTIVHGGPYDRWADQLMAGWWSWGQWLAAAYAANVTTPVLIGDPAAD